MLLLVHQFQTICILAWMLNYYVQRSGRIYEIILAKIIIIYCAYCTGHITFANPQVREFEMQM